MTLVTLTLLALAFSLDLLIGEPPTAVHPVAWYGRLVGLVDREWPTARAARLVGVLVAVVLPISAAALTGWLVLTLGTIHPTAGAVAAAIALFLSTSLRRLLDLTREVVDASEADLEVGRESVRGLVGRETAALSPEAVRSAAIESAAENLADGLVATLVPFALLAPHSLPLAAAAATWVKAVNTHDSMLGYPDKPVGTASARLDDVVMWFPARLSALLLAVAAIDPRALARARTWARAPASPNAGWPMATLAAILGVRLEKPGAYVLNPDAPAPTVDDGGRAISVVGLAGALSVALAALLAAVSPTVGATIAPAVAVPLTHLETPLERAVTASRARDALTGWEVRHP